MTDDDSVRVLEQTPVFEGYLRIDRYRLRHRLFEGGLGPPIDREVLERGQVAAVLPVDPGREEFVLIEQFRPGAYARGWHAWILECVAGIIEPGERAEDVCVREAEEEAGCAITDPRLMVAPFLTSPGASTESVSLFWARVDASNVGGIHGLAHEGENIRVVRFRFDDAERLLAEGRIVNAKTVVALQWLALNRNRLHTLR